jgi:hypothetical protein
MEIIAGLFVTNLILAILDINPQICVSGCL